MIEHIPSFLIGVILGMMIIDQLWRWLYRNASKLIKKQSDLIDKLSP